MDHIDARDYVTVQLHVSTDGLCVWTQQSPVTGTKVQIVLKYFISEFAISGILVLVILWVNSCDSGYSFVFI